MLDKSIHYIYNEQMRCLSKAILFLAVCLSCILFQSGFAFSQEPLETIDYDIKPLGTCVYQDFGIVEYRGQKARLTIFETNVTGFWDKEVIFSEAATYFPLLVQRDLKIFFRNEDITEEYFPRQHYFKLTKFVEGKRVEESSIKGNGPIQNAILVPFSLREAADLKIGSAFNIILPGEFKVTLVSIEEVTVPAGKFKAYHFTSVPPKFEIWISADDLRIPVKIRGLGAFPYTMEMKKRVAKPR